MEPEDVLPSVADEPAWWGGRVDEPIDEELEAYIEWQNSHTCVYQETPDGYGCVNCLYS